MSSINLVGAQDKESLERKNRLKVLRLISTIFLVSIGSLSIILLVLNSRISVEAIRNEQNKVLQNITLLKDKNAKFNLLSDRTRNISQILKTRKNYTNTLNALLDQVPQGVSTTTLIVDKTDVSLTVSSNSLLLLDQFLNNAISVSLKKHVIRDMTIETLTVDKKSGIVSLSIKAKIL